MTRAKAPSVGIRQTKAGKWRWFIEGADGKRLTPFGAAYNTPPAAELAGRRWLGGLREDLGAELERMDEAYAAMRRRCRMTCLWVAAAAAIVVLVAVFA